VTATNAGGVSGPSTIVDGWPQMPPPPTPTGLQLTANGDGTISMSWDAISGAWYWVSWRDVTGGGSFTSYLDETSSGKLTFLKLGHAYQIYLTATNPGGLSPDGPVSQGMSWPGFAGVPPVPALSVSGSR
jgi:hypothetical protein